MPQLHVSFGVVQLLITLEFKCNFFRRGDMRVPMREHAAHIPSCFAQMLFIQMRVNVGGGAVVLVPDNTHGNERIKAGLPTKVEADAWDILQEERALLLEMIDIHNSKCSYAADVLRIYRP